MSIFDLDNYTDAISNAADAVVDVATSIADAGHLIGGVLKEIAPIIALYPGLGTAFSVAVYAAGAGAAKDSLTDAAIGAASTAMPIGLPKIAFDGASNITRNIANGQRITDSVIDTVRKVSNEAGPQAGAAFDAGLKVIQGGAVDPRAIAAGRAFALTSGGSAAAASYDVGVAIAQGKDSEAVVIDAARGYIGDQGGAVARTAFDTGIAMGYGKTLQETGYIALHSFVQGNDAAEQVLNFIEKVAQARNLGVAVQDLLQSDLVSEFQGTVTDSITSGAKQFTTAAGNSALAPYIAAIQKDASLLTIPPAQLALMWQVPEAVIRASQAVMRNGTTPDPALLQALVSQTVSSIGKQDTAGNAARNNALVTQGYQMALADPDVMALRSKRGNYGLQNVIDAGWRRGFDIGTATTVGSKTWGPGQQAIRDSIPSISEFNGFNAARDLQYAKTALKGAAIAAATTGKATVTMSNTASTLGRLPDQSDNDRNAQLGVAIAATNPQVAAARKLAPDAFWQRGFDVAVGAVNGSMIPGPGQTRIMNSLYMPLGDPTRPSLMAGFLVGQSLMWGLAKQRAGLGLQPALSTDPATAAAQLAISGLAGSGSPPGNSATVATALISTPATKAGAASAVAAAKPGFFQSILDFFGL